MTLSQQRSEFIEALGASLEGIFDRGEDLGWTRKEIAKNCAITALARVEQHYGHEGNISHTMALKAYNELHQVLVDFTKVHRAMMTAAIASALRAAGEP